MYCKYTKPLLVGTSGLVVYWMTLVFSPSPAHYALSQVLFGSNQSFYSHIKFFKNPISYSGYAIMTVVIQIIIIMP